MSDVERSHAQINLGLGRGIAREEWVLSELTEWCPCGAPFSTAEVAQPVVHTAQGVVFAGASQWTVECADGHRFTDVEGVRYGDATCKFRGGRLETTNGDPEGSPLTLL